MTSMLLRTRSARSFSATGWLLLLGAVSHGVPELLALLCRGRLDLGAHDVAHGSDPLGDHLPLLAVPLLDEDRAAPLVILAGDLHRMGEALHPEVVQSLVGEVQVLEAPADLFLGRRLLPRLRHGRADGLRGEHGIHDAPVVEGLAHGLLLAGALSLVVDELDDVL